jgi:transcriptional regulator with XRE-family HTH domain
MKPAKPLPDQTLQRIYNGEPALKVLREHRGLSIEELAEATGMTAAFLERCEDGSRCIPDSRLQDVAQALGVTVLDLGHFTAAFGDCDFLTRQIEDD